MFDISPDDILRLDDEQLRELIARLVEADAQTHGHSSLYVTWGGSQTAADGGLDVRATLPINASSCGPGLPKPHTGYQVKKPDMGPSLIIDEMRPKGKLRPVIEELAKNSGAYIIISSTGTTAEVRLAERRQAMRDALNDCIDGPNLHTDFFDRTRIATWVRSHPGLILWVRNAAGREIHGWHPFGHWSHPQRSDNGPYLLDNRLIVSIGNRRADQYTAADAISHLRELLTHPGQAVRLVGLSGVGKTRFVEALFEPLLGENALAKSSAVYTDLNFSPTPQPVTLASTLIAQRHRGVLIVDNCGSGLHAELARTCAQPNSQLSLVTIEYDVREDLPEGTAVVTINSASIKLIEELIQRRYPDLTFEDARIIAEAADGNARVALAIAGTVRACENLTSLTSAELFDKLFWQRHEKDRSLLQAAQVLSLFYSFNIDDSEIGSGRSELEQLADLAKQDVDDLLQHIAELKRRELIQERDRWAAVLPHALANHLAKRALQEIIPRRLYQKVVEQSNSRLACSLARRLAYLSDHPVAIQICALLIEPGGRFGDICTLKSEEIKALADLALVAPVETLQAIERAVNEISSDSSRMFDLLPVIRLLAINEILFDRCIFLLEKAFTSTNGELSGQAHKILLSFFQAVEPQSNASIDVRLAFVLRWRSSDNRTLQNLSEACLRQALSTELSTSKSSASNLHPLIRNARQFDEAKYVDWYRKSLEATKYFRNRDGSPASFVCAKLSHSFAALWTLRDLRENLVARMVECGSGKLWPDGWAACYRALHRFDADETAEAQLRSLIEKFGPTGLGNEVLEVLLSTTSQSRDQLNPETYPAQIERLNKISESLGRRAGAQPSVIEKVATSLLRFGPDAYAFGRGLGESAADPNYVWKILTGVWETVPKSELNPTLLQGYASAMRDRGRSLANQLINELPNDSALISALPALASTIGWNKAAIDRLLNLHEKAIPYEQYRHLYSVPKSGFSTVEDASQLLRQIANNPIGFAVAVDVLLSWIAMTASDATANIEHFRELCRSILLYTDFKELTDPIDHAVTDIATYALECEGPNVEQVVKVLLQKIQESKNMDASYLGSREETLFSISQLQPHVLLSALYDSDEDGHRQAMQIMNNVEHESDHPGRGLEPEKLISWCQSDLLRYDFALTIIPVVEPAAERGRMQLTPQARAILQHSSSPKSTLRGIINRLEPYSWTGSRAAIIEVNSTALDEVFCMFDEDFQSFAKLTKADLLRANQDEQRVDAVYQRRENEKFE